MRSSLSHAGLTLGIAAGLGILTGAVLLRTDGTGPAASHTGVSPSTSPPSGLRFEEPLAPDEALAVLTDGRLVGISAADGRITRELASGLTDRRARVDRSPDGSRIYYAPSSDHGCGQVVEVVASEGERAIGRGCVPRVSPDGRRLAVSGGGGVTVYDLTARGRPTTYATYADPELSRHDLTVYDLTWVAGGTRLAVQLGFEDPADLRIVDPATDPSLIDGTLVEPDGSYVEAVGRDLVLVQNCCYAEGESGELVVRNGATGRTRTLARSPSRRYVAAAPAGGDRLLYASGGMLYRWDGGRSAPVTLGRLEAGLDPVALAW